MGFHFEAVGEAAKVFGADDAVAGVDEHEGIAAAGGADGLVAFGV